MSNWKQTWIPKTDEQLNKEIEKAKDISNIKEPRPLSLVKFADNSAFRKAVNDGVYGGDMDEFSRLLYLGAVPNQPGHGVYINLKSDTTYVIDIEELVEIEEEEV